MMMMMLMDDDGGDGDDDDDDPTAHPTHTYLTWGPSSREQRHRRASLVCDGHARGDKPKGLVSLRPTVRV